MEANKVTLQQCTALNAEEFSLKHNSR